MSRRMWPPRGFVPGVPWTQTFERGDIVRVAKTEGSVAGLVGEVGTVLNPEGAMLRVQFPDGLECGFLPGELRKVDG